jgi:hypothetical protein
VSGLSHLSAYLSIRLPAELPTQIEPLASKWTDFPKIYTGKSLLQAVNIIQVLLQLNKIIGTLRENLRTLMTTLVPKISTDFLGIKFTFITVTSATSVTHVNDVHWLMCIG